MELGMIFGAVWLSFGAIKSLMFLQQMGDLMRWFVYYKTEDSDRARAWKSGYLLLSVFVYIVQAFGFVLVGPVLMWREGLLGFFRPYSDCYIAYMAARGNSIKGGIPPGEHETWEQYQERIGDDPEQVANALVKMQPKVPTVIEDIVETVRDLRELNTEDEIPELSEDEEFKDKDDG